MATKAIDDAILQSIADAIREKSGTTAGLEPEGEMPQAILSIKGAEVEETTNSAGGKTVYINSEPETLPDGFTRLKYIQSDGRQYVDTGVYLGGKSRVVFEFQHVTLDDYNCLFGSRDGAANVNSFAFWAAAQQYLEGYYGSERFAFPDNFPLTNQYTIDWNGNSISMAGTVLSVSRANFTAGFPAYLFAINQGGTASYHAKAKGIACKMYDDNGTLVRNYIPCLNASGEAGLWDTVTKAFFGDAAGVGFIAGPVVLDYELPEGFEELAWIESDGRQYVDTLFKPNNNTRVVMDFHNSGDYSGMTTGLCPLLGARNASSSAAFALWVGKTSYPHYGNVAYNKNGSFSTDINTRLIYDFNKNVANIGSDTITCATATFTTNYNLCLLTVNNYGTIESRKASGKTYSGQIYDNGTLVRYYVPCRTNTGEVGLWDAVNSVFYGDAAGVGFIAGPGKGVSKVVLEDKVLIDLTGDTISPETVLAGFIGHGADGAQFVGELVQKAGGRPFASGNFTTGTATTYTVSGLSFRPSGFFVIRTAINTTTTVYAYLWYHNTENGISIHNGTAKSNLDSSVDISTPTPTVTINADGFKAGSNARINGTYEWLAWGAEG